MAYHSTVKNTADTVDLLGLPDGPVWRGTHSNILITIQLFSPRTEVFISYNASSSRRDIIGETFSNGIRNRYYNKPNETAKLLTFNTKRSRVLADGRLSCTVWSCSRIGGCSFPWQRRAPARA